MSVHPQIEEFLQRLASLELPTFNELTPAEARAQVEDMVKARNIETEPVAAVEERAIPGPGGELPIRIYRPAGDAARQPPILVYFHGGGHVIGSLDTHDAVARSLCNGAACLVASVDYRLAPEAKFPAAAEDAFAATAWLAENAGSLNADGSRMAVAGDSAGANLAAVAALMARDAGGPELRLQVLTYPITDYACESRSYKAYANGYGMLNADSMYWFRDHYLRGNADIADWRASPLRAERLDGLAPALVIAAGCDVLHDETIDYANRLTEAGVPVEVHDYPGMIHGFYAMAPMLDDAVDAQARTFEALKRAFQ